jgi:kinetochore protein Mis13/DSN1
LREVHLANWERQVDHLESFTYSAAQAVLTAEEVLDQRYGMITQRLDALSSLGPPSQGPLHPTPSSNEDPQDLLRALARVDSERPPQEVGDAARRAKREAQRGAGGPERRLTNVDVVMGTPKRSGTPRRERTPGRDR